MEDGLEAYLPLADLVDAAKEKERLGKQATKLQAEIEVRESITCCVVWMMCVRPTPKQTM